MHDTIPMAMYHTAHLCITSAINWKFLQTFLSLPDDEQHVDVTVIRPLGEKTSISLEQVQTLIASLAYGPVYFPQKIALIFPADALTLPAQHALLKTLEEPPENSQLILLTNFPEKLLPTILSRCIITYEKEKEERDISEDSTTLYTKLLDPKTPISQRITLAESYGKNKEDALKICEDILYIAKAALDGGDLQHLRVFSKITEALRLLSANINPKLVLVDTFLSLQ